MTGGSDGPVERAVMTALLWMQLAPRREMVLLGAGLLLTGCADVRSSGNPSYQLGASSAIYAYSSIPVEKPKGGKAGKDGARPRAGVLALWLSTEQGDGKAKG